MVIAAIGRPRDEKAELVKQQPLFRGCTRQEAATVARLADLMTLPAGGAVVRAGERATHFCVIVSGSVLLSHDGGVRAHLVGGDHFGEVGILGDGINPTTATPSADTLAFVTGRRELRTLIDEVPLFRDRLLAAIARQAAQAIPPLSREPAPRSRCSPHVVVGHA